MTYMYRTTVNTKTGRLVEHTMLEGTDIMSMDFPGMNPDKMGSTDARRVSVCVQLQCASDCAVYIV
jgi:hypothetical protein